jgi:predicted nucleic acid-binding protein
LATHLADNSALSRVHHADVAARLESMFIAGRIATCGVVDLEVLLSMRNGPAHAEAAAERQLLPRVPVTEAATRRAVEVQGLLARTGRHRGVPPTDLVIAAIAEHNGLTVLHYDADYDLIAEVTGQPVEWVVPRGSVP